MHSIYQQAMIQAQFPSMCTLFETHYKTCSRAITSTSTCFYKSRAHVLPNLFSKRPTPKQIRESRLFDGLLRSLGNMEEGGRCINPTWKAKLKSSPKCSTLAVGLAATFKSQVVSIQSHFQPPLWDQKLLRGQALSILGYQPNVGFW